MKIITRIKGLLATLLCICLLFTSGTMGFAKQQAVASQEHIAYGSYVYKDRIEGIQQDITVKNSLNAAAVTSIAATGDYYKNQLSGQAQMIYQSLEDSIASTYNGTQAIQVPKFEGITVDRIGTEFQYAIDAFRGDHPEVFWIHYSDMGISYTYRIDSGIIESLQLEPYIKGSDYYVPSGITFEDGESILYFGGETPFTDARAVEAGIAKVNEKVQECLDATANCVTDYEKIKVIHDWLANHIDYDYNYYDQSLYSALVNGKAVCAGYVTAFDYIAQKAGITTIQVAGMGIGKIGEDGENHGWNLVKLEGNWYGLDITWDDMTAEYDKIFYDFFLVGSNTVPESFEQVDFNTSHVLHQYFSEPQISFTIPMLSNSAYSISANGKLGDVDRNGSVELSDAQIVLKVALKIKSLNDITYADADGNGTVDLADAQLVLKAALRIITLGTIES